jgi:type VI protein secretion system component VasA
VSRTHDITISAFDLDRLEADLEAERSLADQLANALLDTMSAWIIAKDAEQAAKTLALWKEARSEI